jgi:hypothetical protein
MVTIECVMPGFSPGFSHPAPSASSRAPRGHALPIGQGSILVQLFFSSKKLPLPSRHFVFFRWSDRSRVPLDFRRSHLGPCFSELPSSGSPAMAGSGGSGLPLPPHPLLLPYPWEKCFLGFNCLTSFWWWCGRGRRRGEGGGGSARPRPLGATYGHWLTSRWTRPRGTAPTTCVRRHDIVDRLYAAASGCSSCVGRPSPVPL